VNWRVALRVADALGHDGLQDLAVSDVRWDRIASIEALADIEVFDVSLLGGGSVLANDVVSQTGRAA
jgi:hypothetical protein